MNKKIFLLFFFFSLLLFQYKMIFAVCPVCTVAVGATLSLSRWLGVDDTISGLWIGGLIVSLILWTIDVLDKKNIHFKARNLIVAVLYYLFLILPLYFMGFLGKGANSLICFCGLHFDKLSLGIFAGSISFWWGGELYYYLKEKNKGHAYFPFQKVLMPIAPLILLSIVFYFLTK